MKPETQRIAIAEACGFHKPTPVVPGAVHWFAADSRAVPDYLNDLNAMHEAEAILSNQQQHNMNELLYLEVVPANERVWRATAAQRAEAFLRTLNLWQS